MSRKLSAAWPIWTWVCDSCGIIHTPPRGADGKYRMPHPSEMRDLGWTIPSGEVYDLCSVCVPLGPESARGFTS